MPALYFESCSNLKDFLAVLDHLPPCNWLISNLECYDTEGWDGSEKWDNWTLFLSDDVLRHDVNLRDMQFIWGAFSAIPVEYTYDEISQYEAPDLENPYYMGNRIVPRHSLALLEISVFDGSYVIVSARDEAILKPFYALPYKIRDEEASNRKMNAELRRIQDNLREMVPDVTNEIANEVQWACWHDLFRDAKHEVDDVELVQMIKHTYRKVKHKGYKCSSGTYWDPYQEK